CLFSLGVKFIVSPYDKNCDDDDPSTRPNAGMLLLMGGLAGFAMGVMGGGGAVFIGAAFILLFKMKAKTAIGTSILVMGVAAIPGVLSHWLSGTIAVPYAVAILVSSAPAAFAASLFANRVPTPVVKRLLGVYLVVISVLLLYRLFF
ncbi:MAG: TSUP family transporter, partial [Pirellulaceae bacterium]|nr:TSUP family transporter [Pirellulaceae bacterium]